MPLLESVKDIKQVVKEGAASLYDISRDKDLCLLPRIKDDLGVMAKTELCENSENRTIHDFPTSFEEMQEHNLSVYLNKDNKFKFDSIFTKSKTFDAKSFTEDFSSLLQKLNYDPSSKSEKTGSLQKDVQSYLDRVMELLNKHNLDKNALLVSEKEIDHYCLKKSAGKKNEKFYALKKEIIRDINALLSLTELSDAEDSLLEAMLTNFQSEFILANIQFKILEMKLSSIDPSEIRGTIKQDLYTLLVTALECTERFTSDKYYTQLMQDGYFKRYEKEMAELEIEYTAIQEKFQKYQEKIDGFKR